MAYIEGKDRKQKMIFPEYLEDYITEENVVRVIDEYVNTLDLKELGFTKTDEYRRGAPGYHPGALLKLYIYGYMNSVRSSRKLEKETHKNLEVIWLMQKLKPDFKTIADFRKDNKEAIREVFRDFTFLCKELGLYGEKLIAIDGTKIKADNSKKNNYNAKKINRQLEHIAKKITEYLELLDNADNKEALEKKYTAEEIKEKLERLKERKEKYDNLQKALEETGATEISTVDPDARLMDNKNNGADVSYNVQTAVDSKHKLVVAIDVTNNPADQGNLNSMAEKAKEVFGKEEIEALADKGYYQAEDLKKCEKNKTTTYITKQSFSNSTGDRDFYGDKFVYDSENDWYICPAGEKLFRIQHRVTNPKRVRYRNFEACKNCQYKDRCTKSKKGREINRSPDQDFLDRVDARTQENMDKYLMRQMIVEHPFGTIKRHMDSGYFLTRGLLSVYSEMALTMFAYNFKRVINILGIKEFIRKIREVRPSYLNIHDIKAA